ncbi:hypothetical protein BT93_J1839 [Corymbia citriodora subsp. variegata]|nr:hypothetical protein BT93_J1839 [Corymbia citriodora subsp. variegata]
MDASEVAVSLLIARLRDLLCKSEDVIIDQEVRDQIFHSISDIQRILNTRKHAKLNDDHNQENGEGEGRLLPWARRAEEIAEEFFIQSLQDRRSKWQKGRFAKGFARVRFFSVVNQVLARKKMAKDFMKEFRLLSKEFTSSLPPAEEGLPDNKRASSSKSNRENTRQRVESDIVGRDEYVKELLAWLIGPKDDDDSNLRVISVVGERACGKTALVRSVFSKLEIKHHFDCRAWVRVADLGVESDPMKNLLVDILKQTPLPDNAKDLEHKKEEQLFEMLHKSLMEIRYLIVLDNLCEASLINKLLVPFVDSAKGSRVIITTPNAEMQKFADPWTPSIRLPPDMTDEECKKLLQVSIARDDDLESEMTILEQILRKCNGPPPAISLLGGLLSSVEVSNCVAIIDQLRDRPTLDDVMHLSFDELPYMMKPCALYMAVFPKESEVPTRRLFRQWAAEGLLAEAADRSVQMPSAEDCFRELESRNLICVIRRKLDGRAQSCRLPGFLHEFFHQKAKKFGLRQIQYSSDSHSEEESRIMGPEAEQSAKQVQNKVTGHYSYHVQFLRSFASFNTCKLGMQAQEIEFLLKSPILEGRPIQLRVLDLEGVYKPVLPETFGNTLSNLRYLGLRWTVLESIPKSVRNLLLLETLDLKHTNVTKVTSTIWNAKNLQHLYLSEASFDNSIPHRISTGKSLNTKLQTLWGVFIETAKSPMISVLGKLQSLKKLGVTCRPGAVKAVTEQVSKLAMLESLRLGSRDQIGQPASLNLSNMTGLESLSNLYLLGSLRPVQDLSLVLPGNLQALTLSMSELEVNPMPVLKCLKYLMVLRLLARSYTGPCLRCEAGFPELRILKLWRIEELETLVFEEGAMPNLEELEIRRCKKLATFDGLHHINSLKSASLTEVQEDLAKRVPPHILVKTKELVSKKESTGKK